MKFLVGPFLLQVLSIIFAGGAVYMATHGIAKWRVLVVAAIICVACWYGWDIAEALAK